MEINFINRPLMIKKLHVGLIQSFELIEGMKQKQNIMT